MIAQLPSAEVDEAAAGPANYKDNGTVLVGQRVGAKFIEKSRGYHGQPIRLLFCNAGACDAGFAKNLAKMGISVEVPIYLV